MYERNQKEQQAFKNDLQEFRYVEAHIHSLSPLGANFSWEISKWNMVPVSNQYNHIWYSASAHLVLFFSSSDGT